MGSGASGITDNRPVQAAQVETAPKPEAQPKAPPAADGVKYVLPEDISQQLIAEYQKTCKDVCGNTLDLPGVFTPLPDKQELPPFKDANPPKVEEKYTATGAPPNTVMDASRAVTQSRGQVSFRSSATIHEEHRQTPLPAGATPLPTDGLGQPQLANRTLGTGFNFTPMAGVSIVGDNSTVFAPTLQDFGSLNAAFEKKGTAAGFNLRVGGAWAPNLGAEGVGVQAGGELSIHNDKRPNSPTLKFRASGKRSTDGTYESRNTAAEVTVPLNDRGTKVVGACEKNFEQLPPNGVPTTTTPGQPVPTATAKGPQTRVTNCKVGVGQDLGKIIPPLEGVTIEGAYTEFTDENTPANSTPGVSFGVTAPLGQGKATLNYSHTGKGVDTVTGGVTFETNPPPKPLENKP